MPLTLGRQSRCKAIERSTQEPNRSRPCAWKRPFRVHAEKQKHVKSITYNKSAIPICPHLKNLLHLSPMQFTPRPKDMTDQTETETQFLRRIIAMLLSLAGIAERAANRSSWVTMTRLVPCSRFN